MERAYYCTSSPDQPNFWCRGTRHKGAWKHASGPQPRTRHHQTANSIIRQPTPKKHCPSPHARALPCRASTATSSQSKRWQAREVASVTMPPQHQQKARAVRVSNATSFTCRTKSAGRQDVPCARHLRFHLFRAHFYAHPHITKFPERTKGHVILLRTFQCLPRNTPDLQQKWPLYTPFVYLQHQFSASFNHTWGAGKDLSCRDKYEKLSDDTNGGGKCVSQGTKDEGKKEERLSMQFALFPFVSVVVSTTHKTTWPPRVTIYSKLRSWMYLFTLATREAKRK